jgi:hypothetical protein
LIYAAGEELPWRDLRQVWRPVSVLAVGLVMASAAAVAAVAGAVTPLATSTAFVLGAILASTDPVAVTALARRLSLPARVQALVQARQPGTCSHRPVMGKGPKGRILWRMPRLAQPLSADSSPASSVHGWLVDGVIFFPGATIRLGSGHQAR